MPDKDITAEVSFYDNDGDSLPLTRCACGAKFPAWEFILGTYADMAHTCPHCGRRLYFRNSIRVFEVAG
jgi:DNA-directed RNA polymerase subunit RPC12/RpoP